MIETRYPYTYAADQLMSSRTITKMVYARSAIRRKIDTRVGFRMDWTRK
jgi:hypothetical protein